MRVNTRINLLSDAEIDALYAFPEFNEVEQSLYFEFTTQEINLAKQYRTLKVQVCFMRSLGYFKAKQQFFVFDLDSLDTQYVLQKYFAKKESPLSGQIDERIYRKQREDILLLLGYQNWSPNLEPQVKSQLVELLRYYPKAHNAIRQLLEYFNNQKIVIPSYRTLQDIFTAAFSIEETRLNKLMLSIPKQFQKCLSTLIGHKDGISLLNKLRADQADFHYTAVKEEVKKAQSIADLYTFLQNFMPTLKLSKNGIRYYSDVTDQYPSSRLRKLSKSQQWLYALCFVYHRYQQIMNNLITSFLYHIKVIMDEGKLFAEAEEAKHNAERAADFSKLAQFLQWFPLRDHSLNHDELNDVAYKILPETQFSALATFFNGKVFNKTAAKWKFYLKSFRQFSRYLRPILLSVDFTFYKEGSHLMALVDFLKAHYIKHKSPSKLKVSEEINLIISKNMLRYLKRDPNDEQLNPYLLEFFVYQKMYHHLNRGRLCCNDSVSYCDIDHDLVSDNLVDDIEALATKFSYPKIPLYCDSRLDEALVALDNAWETTTENIRLGENKGLKLKKSKTDQQEWSLLYDASTKLDDTFFKTLPKIDIADVIIFIGDFIRMWDGFIHMKDRYVKRTKPLTLAFSACILSEAFGVSDIKMAEMSDISFNVLRSTREDFFRVETLCSVNDRVANYIHSLPIFKVWNLLDDKLLADGDGQKFATSDNTLQSRYSKKYLGKGKGISLYTLIANFVAVNAKTIGLNEYEGHFLFDMIYNNKTDIDIAMVTGDNHSLNQVNYLAMDAIDVDYIPSIKNIREAADTLYSVKPPDHYTGLLKPIDKIKTDRIKSEKRGISRVLLSLIMQENTQSHIIRKLNSHARYASLKAGLFEYNKIFKSIHVLNLINDMSLRKAIRTARNRTEAYHQLQGLIRKIYNGIFKGKKVVDNRVSAHAARLVANCIVAHNSTILNAIYLKMLETGVAKEIINEFARISPIAWVYILFTGKYNFKKNNGDLDIAAMALEVEKLLKEHFWKV